MTLGEGHLRVLVGVGDLYLELTSIVLVRRVAATALFFSVGTRGGLVVSVADAAFLDTYDTSIQAKLCI